MSLTKVICPGCNCSLNIKQTLPARLRCPKCQARFQAAADGSAILSGTVEAVEEPSGGLRLPLLAATGAVVLLFVVLGGALLAYCLFAPDGSTTDAEEDAPSLKNAKPLPLVQVAFVKQAPKNAKGIGLAVGKVAAAADAPSGVAKGIPSLASNQKEIDAAIHKGVAYLKKNVEGNGRFRGHLGEKLGCSALVGLTLLSAGVPADDPVVGRIANRVRSEGPKETLTYDLACCIWFLDKLGQTGDADLIRKMALRIIHGQNTAGGWGYVCDLLNKDQEEQLLALLEQHAALRGSLTENAAPKQSASKLPVLQFKPGQKLEGPDDDNSVTQFAVLGLWAAQKHGVPVGPSLLMAEARFRQCQAGDGSWSYKRAPGQWKDAMTCAGLVGLAAGRGSVVGTEKAGTLANDPQIQRALTFLGERLTILGLPLPQAERNKLTAERDRLAKEIPAAKGEEQVALKKQVEDIEKRLRRGTVQGGNRLIHADVLGDLYFLWSVERVGVLYDLDTIGGNNWHSWGADILLHFQEKDGRWADSHEGAIDTCFAILFLKRVNVANDLTKVLQGLGGIRDPGAKPGEGNAVATTAGNKADPTLAPGAAKVRNGYALPANRPPTGRARRRRRGRWRTTPRFRQLTGQP